MATRVRTTGAYGAVFGVFLRQKLAAKPFTSWAMARRSAISFMPATSPPPFCSAAENERTGRIWNLGAGNPQTVNRLVELIGGQVTYIPRRPGEPNATWADISRITSELDWRPLVSFEDGVSRMMAEIEVWKDAPLWDSESIAKATKVWFDYVR